MVEGTKRSGWQPDLTTTTGHFQITKGHNAVSYRGRKLLFLRPRKQYLAPPLSDSTTALKTSASDVPHEVHIPVGAASLYARDIGKGTAIIVLHGGPDFDHRYLLPELDGLADSYHEHELYQAGRSQSQGGRGLADD